MHRLIAIITAAVLFAAAGCGHPLSAYDQGRKMLDRGHERLLQGDADTASRRLDAALTSYNRAVQDMTNAADYFQQAEMQVMDEIRTSEQQQRLGEGSAVPTSSATVHIGTRQAQVSAFYAETLRAYREARALAVVLKGLGLARSAEASYRRGALRVHSGDYQWKNSQFNSALDNYRQARESFLASRQSLAEASTFIERQTLSSSRLSEVAPRDTWQRLEQLRPLINQRLSQVDLWLVALDGRLQTANRIVDAYRQTRPGNLPGVQPPFLEPLPSRTRIGVQHPPIPANRTAR